jgi:hypothetical protein
VSNNFKDEVTVVAVIQPSGIIAEPMAQILARGVRHQWVVVGTAPGNTKIVFIRQRLFSY